MNTETMCKTLPEFLTNTLREIPDYVAYRYFDHDANRWVDVSWQAFADDVLRWRKAFYALGLKKGDRVAMVLVNCLEALTFDQAALANGLVPVPLHAIDTPSSLAYALSNSGSRLLITGSTARVKAVFAANEDLSDLENVIITGEDADEDVSGARCMSTNRFIALGENVSEADIQTDIDEEDLAAIIYTSGTTGKPKGVMLTHRNVVSNVYDIAVRLNVKPGDTLVGFLPLSHAFERTVTYYNSVLCGATLVFTRGIPQLLEDYQLFRPKLLVMVPSVLEKISQKVMASLQKASNFKRTLFLNVVAAGWRQFCKEQGLPIEFDGVPLLDWFFLMLKPKVARPILSLLGDTNCTVISGGAALNYDVAKLLCGLGLKIRQGYGLTENSPVVCVSELDRNHPATVGDPLRRVEVRQGENDELQLRGPSVMKGYYKNPEATKAAFTEDGWLKTGDIVDLSDDGRIRIVGRLKEIIVTSTGEKIPPVDLEFAIQKDPLFKQVLIIGEARSFVTALVVLDPEDYAQICQSHGLDPADKESATHRLVRLDLLKRIKTAAVGFPQYGIPRNVYPMTEPWTTDNGLLTVTLKMRRKEIMKRFEAEIDAMYAKAKIF